MKKLFTILTLAVLPFIGNSQTNSLYCVENNAAVTNSIIDINVNPSDFITTEVWFIRSASTLDTFAVERTVFTLDVDDVTQFCWGGLCYGPTTNYSPYTVAINNGLDTITYVESGFHATIQLSTVNINRAVHYKFVNIHNANDTVGVTLRYLATSGINEASKLSATISNTFPNPVNATSFINYKFDTNFHTAKIVFYDVLGNTVKQIALTNKEGVEKINSSEFEQGIYFYSLIADDKKIATKKFVVSSK